MPSSLLYRGALLLSVLSLGLGAWHMVAWPAFPGPPLPPSGLRAMAAPETPSAVAEPGPAEETVPTTGTPASSAGPAPSPPEQRRYAVEPGDTLLGIALRFGLEMEAIAQANNLADPAALTIGQELVIP